MKRKNNVLITLVIMLSLLDVCLALANYSTQPNETVKNIEVNFPDEQRWVEVMEGSGGGGSMDGFVKIHIEDKGYDYSPYVTISDERGTIRNFSMTENEVAKIYIMDKQDGSVLKTITIKDPQDSVSYEVLQLINEIVTGIFGFLSQFQITFS